MSPRNAFVVAGLLGAGFSCDPIDPSGSPMDPETCDTPGPGPIDDLQIGAHDLEPFAPWEDGGTFHLTRGFQGFNMLVFRVAVSGANAPVCVAQSTELLDVRGMPGGWADVALTTDPGPDGYRLTDGVFLIPTSGDLDFVTLRTTVRLAAGDQMLERTLVRAPESSAAAVPPPPLEVPIGPEPTWQATPARVVLSSVGEGRAQLTLEAPATTDLVATLESTDVGVFRPAFSEVVVPAGEVAADLGLVGAGPGIAWLVIRLSDGTDRAIVVQAV
jgi:hypothetical protein